MELNEENNINSQDQNGENNKKKGNKARKIINTIFVIFLVTHIFSYSMLPKLTPSESVPENSESVIQETVPTASSEMVGNMEFIGCTRNAVVTSPITFYYYRDIVTDQMFLITYNSGDHTVTPMIHPETGLPLTYSEYQAMENSE